MMAPVEQAIFTSAQTERATGYHLVAVSPGVSEADRRELSIWGPSHDSLLDPGSGAASLNFHPLGSGAFCVSRSTPAGWEYSGRGGRRVYTHCLIVPPDVLARFANHPFAVVRAAVAAGAMEVHDEVPARLAPLELAGRSPAVDQTRLGRLAAQLGPRRLALLMQAAAESACLAVGGIVGADRLMAGILDCLPPECRTAVSFSTGLKFSSRRPFRVVALPDDAAERRWLLHQPGMVVLDLADPHCEATALMDGWARLIERAIALGRTPLLAAQLSKHRGDLTPRDLPALGLQLLEELEANTFQEAQPYGPEPHAADGPEHGQAEPASMHQAHAAHHLFEKSGGAAAAVRSAIRAPSKSLDPDSPEVVEKLEALDDAVFDAISGRAAALVHLRELWPVMRSELGDDMLAESREQYLRYALSVWEQCVDEGTIREPTRAVQALDVLCVLFDDV
jgi:hypothetical protein